MEKINRILTKDEFCDGNNIGDICKFSGRTEKGVSSRLARLGIIGNRKDIYKYLEK